MTEDQGSVNKRTVGLTVDGEDHNHVPEIVDHVFCVCVCFHLTTTGSASETQGIPGVHSGMPVGEAEVVVPLLWTSVSLVNDTSTLEKRTRRPKRHAVLASNLLLHPLLSSTC